MQKELLERLNQWHEENEHGKIIEAILAIPEAERDYGLVGLLARAYNNAGSSDSADDNYEKAIASLLSVKERGERDPLWLFRLGYAYFYSARYEEALRCFEKCKELNPDEQDVDIFLSMTERYLSPPAADSRSAGDADAADEPDYTAVIKHEDSVSVCFYIEHEKPLAVGEKMCEINENAYMNGYGWAAFLNYYLSKHAPDVLDGMDADPEAGMYAADYDLSAENEAKANKFVNIIKGLIENREELYRIVREHGDEIEWD